MCGTTISLVTWMMRLIIFDMEKYISILLWAMVQGTLTPPAPTLHAINGHEHAQENATR